jgi:leader peptidase (prepilin peptidase)/N-methyltransferase
VEIATGAVFAFLYWYYGPGAELAVLAFYFSLFIVLLVIDLEHRLILNKVVYPSSLVALAASIFLSQLEVVPGIASAAGGGAIGLGLFFLVAVIARGGMGLGDVKMAALIGLIVGFPLVFVALFLAVISGGAVAAALMMVKAKDRKQSIPFGPFLSLGAMATLLWGSDILNWYGGFFS